MALKISDSYRIPDSYRIMVIVKSDFLPVSSKDIKIKKEKRMYPQFIHSDLLTRR